MSLSKSELTDAKIDAVWQRMNGDTEWLRTFGYQQFAQAILNAVMPIQDPSASPCADPIVERNVSLLRERSAVGVQKYGMTLADNKLPLRAWLNHALEEALDQANYLQAAMVEIDSAERALPPLPEYFPGVTNIRADEEFRAQQYAMEYARSALAASPVQPVAVPDGWKLVPTEPTEAMMHAAQDVPAPRPYGAVYRAMLATAPAAPAALGDAKEKILLAALQKAIGWCEDPGFRTNHTAKQMQTLLDGMRKEFLAAIAAKAAPTPK